MPGAGALQIQGQGKARACPCGRQLRSCSTVSDVGTERVWSRGAGKGLQRRCLGLNFERLVVTGGWYFRGT